MLLLKSFKGEPHDNDSLRRYQLQSWGQLGGEACVIELSGVPGPNRNSAMQNVDQLFRGDEFQLILRERIENIAGRMKEARPRLVIMYGKNAWSQYRAMVTLCKHAIDNSFRCESIGRHQVEIMQFSAASTTIVLAPHPRYAQDDSFWISLGERLANSS